MSNPVSTVDVPVWVHDEVNGVPVEANFPFRDALLSENCPMVVEHERPELAHRLGRISTSHGRSYEMDFGTNNTDGTPVNWTDEFGNPFTSITTKGNNCTEMRMTSSVNAPSGYMPMGLLETSSIERVLKASKILREAHVDTEWFVGIVEPKVLPVEDGFVNPAQFKLHLLEQLMDDTKETNIPPDEIPMVATALNEMAFFVGYRAMLVPERLYDLEHMRFDFQMRPVLKRAFSALHLINPEIRPLDPENKEDRIEYFTEHLPRAIGKNMALMHNLGLTHGFPHMGNISLLGGLYDLDSAKGELLGDEAVSEEAKILDVRRFLHGEAGMGDFDRFFSKLKNLDAIGDSNEAVFNFKVAFLESYMAERDIPFTSDSIEAKAALMFEYTSALSKSLGDAWLDRFVHELDLSIRLQMFENLDELYTLHGEEAGLLLTPDYTFTELAGEELKMIIADHTQRQARPYIEVAKRIYGEEVSEMFADLCIGRMLRLVTESFTADEIAQSVVNLYKSVLSSKELAVIRDKNITPLEDYVQTNFGKDPRYISRNLHGVNVYEDLSFADFMQAINDTFPGVFQIVAHDEDWVIGNFSSPVGSEARQRTVFSDVKLDLSSPDNIRYPNGSGMYVAHYSTYKDNDHPTDRLLTIQTRYTREEILELITNPRVRDRIVFAEVSYSVHA